MVVVQEHKSAKYTPRTYFNASSGDVTLAMAVDLNTAGEILTHKAAGEKYIGFLLDNNIHLLLGEVKHCFARMSFQTLALPPKTR